MLLRLIRRREYDREPGSTKEARVPDGPPVRWVGCDKDCETRWDREPKHSEACQQRHREADARVDQMQLQTEREWAEYNRYREGLSK